MQVGGHALNSHGNYIVDHGKSWKNHGIVFLNFCGNPVINPAFKGNDNTKPHSLMSDPICTMYFHNMSCDLSKKILFKPNLFKHLSGAECIFIRPLCSYSINIIY